MTRRKPKPPRRQKCARPKKNRVAVPQKAKGENGLAFSSSAGRSSVYYRHPPSTELLARQFAVPRLRCWCCNGEQVQVQVKQAMRERAPVRLPKRWESLARERECERVHGCPITAAAFATHFTIRCSSQKEKASGALAEALQFHFIPLCYSTLYRRTQKCSPCCPKDLHPLLLAFVVP